MSELTVNVNVNISNTDDAKSMEQSIYRYAMPTLKTLREKELAKTITAAEKQEKDEILYMLFYLIKNYGYDIMNNMTKGCYLRAHDREDLDTTIKLAFMEHIYDYDPNQTTPTTFFKHYFIEAVRDFLQQCMGVTQYDATNMRKVKSVLNHFEVLNKECTPDIISQVTGLSPKVVKKTLELLGVHKVDIDEIYDVRSNQITPEESYLENEKIQTMYDIIKKNLSPTEEHFLLLRLNMEGTKIRTHSEIAKLTGRDLYEVSNILGEAKRKLRDNEELKEFLGSYYKKYVHRDDFDEENELFTEDLSILFENLI